MRARTANYTAYAYRHVPSSKQDSRIILRDDATTSTALVPVRTGTNIPGLATTVCTGATCVRVPESTNDTRTGSYHHPNKGQGSYHAMSPRLRYYEYEYCTRLRIMYRRHMRTVHQSFSRRVYMDYRSASAPPQTPRLAS